MAAQPMADYLGRRQSMNATICICFTLGAIFVLEIVGPSQGTFSAPQGAARSGLVNYIGEQRQIVGSGRASGTFLLVELANLRHLYALGPVEGLDGEITIFDGKPYVSQVRGETAYVVDQSFNHRAIFLAWAQVKDWNSLCVPPSVTNYSELETFIRKSAEQLGVDTDAAFPFLMSGAPRELGWHINVDRTDGQPITQELFQKSKQHYSLREECVDIVGVYSEKHQGIFTRQGLKTHLHFVSRESAATGHIDTITPAGLTLRLPRR
jgi:acetolactate decarboxylase